MNRSLYALVAAAPLLVTTRAAAAEQSSDDAAAQAYPNALQADLGLGVIGLAYERLFERRIGLQLEAQIFGTWFGPTVDLPNMTGFGGQVRPSFFLTEDGPRGVYVAPFLRVNHVSADVNGVTKDGQGFSTGVFAGYAFLLGSRVNLRVGAGAQYMSYAVDPQGTRTEFRTFFPALDLVLGYVF